MRVLPSGLSDDPVMQKAHQKERAALLAQHAELLLR